MKITRRQLRKLISESFRNPMIVQKINTLISDAKTAEEDFRAGSEDFYARIPMHIQDSWQQINELIRAIGMDVNPPKELSAHSVVDAEEGEVLASYLTYDQAVAYGRQHGGRPVDGFEGNPVDMPVVAQGTRDIYFIFDYI